MSGDDLIKCGVSVAAFQQVSQVMAEGMVWVGFHLLLHIALLVFHTSYFTES